MLAGLRSDPIPVAFKDRHTKTVSRSMYKPKPVFDRWKTDDPEILKKAFDYDSKLIPATNITNDDTVDASTLLRAI